MIEYREFPLTQELMERLIAFSEDWAAEKSCTGYRANTPEDIEGNRVFLATDVRPGVPFTGVPLDHGRRHALLRGGGAVRRAGAPLAGRGTRAV